MSTRLCCKSKCNYLTNFVLFSLLQNLKELTKKQDRDNAEMEAQAFRRRGGAASPILEVMSKEMGVTTTTTALKSPSTTANDARMSWCATSSPHEAAATCHGGGHAPSLSRAKTADPDKAGKELLASTF